MSNKLFVGGLSWATSEDDLRRAFEKFGEILEVQIISDRTTGRSLGFGFVTFAKHEAASKAMAEMNGTELDGRTLRVDEARERARGRGRDRRETDRGGRGQGY